MVHATNLHAASIALVTLGGILVPSGRACAQAYYALDAAHSEVTFDATSTMGRFQGRAGIVTGTAMTFDTITFFGTSGAVRINVASVHTGIGLRDRHMRSAMQADRFPEVVLTVDSVALESVPDSVHRVVLFGTIDFRGVRRDRIITATLHSAGDTFTVSGRIPMRFTEFDMDPPTRMLGMVRVKDEWEIAFTTRFVRAAH